MFIKSNAERQLLKERRLELKNELAESKPELHNIPLCITIDPHELVTELQSNLIYQLNKKLKWNGNRKMGYVRIACIYEIAHILFPKIVKSKISKTITEDEISTSIGTRCKLLKLNEHEETKCDYADMEDVNCRHYESVNLNHFKIKYYKCALSISFKVSRCTFAGVIK